MHGSRQRLGAPRRFAGSKQCSRERVLRMLCRTVSCGWRIECAQSASSNPIRCRQKSFGHASSRRCALSEAIGDVTVASSYRDEALNTCVHGASQSAHRNYYALDLVPVDAGITRQELIETLCPIHAHEGRRLDIGLGIYRAQRFHIDARGWGEDFQGATFPCRSVSG